ncbi:MAG TPA: hypothetical protein VD947_03825 [Patescibacteria group bacterium]|nr:hypothetical protein [Patescibacteria group bacterium]
MAIRKVTKAQIENISKQEEKILNILKTERHRAKKKFPLVYALVATFGLVATIAGFNRVIEKIDFLDSNPFILVILGVGILIATGAAYKKLG